MHIAGRERERGSSDASKTCGATDSSLVSRWDRMLIFGGLNLAALALFVVCFVLLPTGVFILKPQKFVIL